MRITKTWFKTELEMSIDEIKTFRLDYQGGKNSIHAYPLLVIFIKELKEAFGIGGKRVRLKRNNKRRTD